MRALISCNEFDDICQKKDVQKRFNQEFKMPRITLENEIHAPPLTHNWPLMGTAFDYLMRFRLERLAPRRIPVDGLPKS